MAGWKEAGYGGSSGSPVAGVTRSGACDARHGATTDPAAAAAADDPAAADVPPDTARPVGALYYLRDPPPGLADAAQRRLGLAQPPRELLLATPGPLRHDPKIEAAAHKAAIGLLKLVTLELAKQPGLPASIRTGVPLAWSVYNARALYQRWQEGADIPTLAVGVGELMLDGWGKATDAGILTGSAALTPGMADSFGFALLTADAVKDGKDLTMALLDDKLASTSPLYKAAKMPGAGAGGGAERPAGVRRRDPARRCRTARRRPQVPGAKRRPAR